MANRERGKLRKLDWQVWEQEPDKQSSDPSPPHLPFRNNLFAESTHYPLSLTQLKCYISALGEEACQSLDRPVGWKVWIFMGFNIYGVQYLCHIPKMSVPAALAILQLTFRFSSARLLCLSQVNQNEEERFRWMLCTAPLQTPDLSDSTRWTKTILPHTRQLWYPSDPSSYLNMTPGTV